MISEKKKGKSLIKRVLLGIVLIAIIVASIITVYHYYTQSRGYQEKLIQEYITKWWSSKLDFYKNIDTSTIKYSILFNDDTVQVKCDGFNALSDFQKDEMVEFVYYSVDANYTPSPIQKNMIYTKSEVLCNADVYVMEFTDAERLLYNNDILIRSVNLKEEAEADKALTKRMAGAAQDLLENNSEKTSSITNDEKSHVWVEAKYAVKEKLKSPSTADFPSINNANITKSGTSYTVSSYVDAQNSYGATVRTDFTVTVKKSGDVYTVTSVVMD